MRFVAALPLLILSVAAVAHGQFGTKSLPALSCQSLLSRGAKPSSGLYWIKPKGVAAAFQGYCDMETFGGGWLMCYTTNLLVHVSREVNSTVPYASNGYRSDCRNYPFNHVMLVPCLGSPNFYFSAHSFWSVSVDGCLRAGTWTILQRSVSTTASRLCGSNSMALEPSRLALPGTLAA